jgi:hypothetical protein
MTEISLKLTVEYKEAAGSSKELVAALQRAVEVAIGSGLLGHHVENWVADVREVDHLPPPKPMYWTIQRMANGQVVDGPILYEFHKLDDDVRTGVIIAFSELAVEGLMFHCRPSKRSFEIASIENFDKRLPEMLKDEAYGINISGDSKVHAVRKDSRDQSR